MNLENLRALTLFLTILFIIAAVVAALSGGEFFAILFSVGGSFSLFTWLAATVADATVRTLKKEN